jgi:hypothetical protein
MATSLTSQTRIGFERAEVFLGEDRELVARARATSNEASGDRDRLLEQIIRAYRSGAREIWAAVLLDLLTPALVDRLKRYRPEPPALDQEDIRQQLVLELLRAAASMPLPTGAGYVERRLVLRAGQGVRRWLARERRFRAMHEPLESVSEEGR